MTITTRIEEPGVSTINDTTALTELRAQLLATQRALVDYAKEAKSSRFAAGSDDDGTDARHDAALTAARAAVAKADGKEAV